MRITIHPWKPTLQIVSQPKMKVGLERDKLLKIYLHEAIVWCAGR
jgi:hypothetical protein